MKIKDFVNKEDVLKALKSQIKWLSEDKEENEDGRRFFAECFTQFEEIESKAKVLDKLMTPYKPNDITVMFHDANSFDGNCLCGQAVDSSQNHCHTCGQKLEW